MILETVEPLAMAVTVVAPSLEAVTTMVASVVVDSAAAETAE